MSIDWQLLIKLGVLFVILDQQAFVNPEENEVEDSSKEVHDRQTGGVHEHNVQIGDALSVNVVA